MESGSILKMINTKANTKEENHSLVRKHLNYIMRSDATYNDLIWTNMVEKDNILDDFGYFARSSGKDNGRPLKHLVVSYKVKDDKALSWQEYLEVTKEIASFYSKDYQMVAAVHSNIKKRPHAHIVIDCFNVSTEKKFSEGLRELEKLKDFVDEILMEHNIPQLLRKKYQDIPKEMNEGSKDEEYMPIYNYGIAQNFEMPILYQAIGNNDVTAIEEVNKFFDEVPMKSIEKEIYDFFVAEPEDTKSLFKFGKLLRGERK